MQFLVDQIHSRTLISIFWVQTKYPSNLFFGRTTYNFARKCPMSERYFRLRYCTSAEGPQTKLEVNPMHAHPLRMSQYTLTLLYCIIIKQFSPSLSSHRDPQKINLNWIRSLYQAGEVLKCKCMMVSSLPVSDRYILRVTPIIMYQGWSLTTTPTLPLTPPTDIDVTYIEQNEL
jgi:hypothetical protein